MKITKVAVWAGEWNTAKDFRPTLAHNIKYEDKTDCFRITVKKKKNVCFESNFTLLASLMIWMVYCKNWFDASGLRTKIEPLNFYWKALSLVLVAVSLLGNRNGYVVMKGMVVNWESLLNIILIIIVCLLVVMIFLGIDTLLMMMNMVLVLKWFLITWVILKAIKIIAVIIKTIVSLMIQIVICFLMPLPFKM